MRWAALGLVVAALGCRKVGRGHQAPPPGPLTLLADAGGEAPDRLIGEPIVLAGGQVMPFALATDASWVYWVNLGYHNKPSGSIMKVAKGGGTPVLLADFEKEPVQIAVDREFVYWATYGLIRRVAKTGGPAETLFSGHVGFLGGFAVGAGAVYFSDHDRGTVSRLAKAGGPPTVLATEQELPGQIVEDGPDVYWVKSGALDGANGAIMRWRDGVLEVVQGGLAVPRGLALTKDDLFTSLTPRAISPTGGILRVPKHGGEPQTLFESHDLLTWYASIAVDASYVYFPRGTRGDATTIARVPLRGGAVETVAHTLPLFALAADDSGVYYAVNPDLTPSAPGAILEIAKAPR